MNKRMKLLLIGALLVLVALSVAACGKWGTPYPGIDEQGYTVSVRFDVNGGQFGSTKDMYVIDAYRYEDAVAGVPLLQPDSDLRGDNKFNISRVDYRHVGWYKTRELRVNEAGEPLDDYGELCSASGRAQGYIYRDPWDFEKDRLTVEAGKTYTSGENVLTLYAAWVPYFTYEFYEVDPATGAFVKYTEIKRQSLAFPVEEEGAAAISMKDFPTRDGMTLVGAYLDEAMTETQDPAVPLLGSINYERGVIEQHTVKIYTEWKDGVWYKIHSLEQFMKNLNPSASYEILADLDFAGMTWPFAKAKFTGAIEGNGHTFRNISVTQSDISQIYGGLFGILDRTARIEDLCFENASYTLNVGSRMQTPSFGLLCGIMNEGATLSGVTFTDCKLLIGKGCYPTPGDGYQLGLLCGSGNTTDLDLSGITCELEEGAKFDITVDDGVITLTPT